MKKLVRTVFLALLLGWSMLGCASGNTEEGQGQVQEPPQTDASGQEAGEWGLESEAAEEKDSTAAEGRDSAAAEETSLSAVMGLLTVDTDEREAVRNSNKLNFGALSEGENGRIYYIDKVHNRVIESGVWGEDAGVVYEGAVKSLQEAEGYLYLQLDTGLLRLDCETGESRLLWEAPFGEFLVVKDKVYINCGEGFCVMDRDGGNREVLLGKPQAASFMPCGNGWLCVEISETDPSVFWEGHLLFLKEGSGKAVPVGTGFNYPLSAGRRIIVFNSETKSFHIWDPETGEDTDSRVYVQKMVSDGEKLYYFADRSNDRDETRNALLCWDGKNVAELGIFTGRVENNALYMAHGYLYWISQTGEEVQWICFHPETGEMGVLPNEVPR